MSELAPSSNTPPLSDRYDIREIRPGVNTPTEQLTRLFHQLLSNITNTTPNMSKALQPMFSFLRTLRRNATSVDILNLGLSGEEIASMFPSTSRGKPRKTFPDFRTVFATNTFSGSEFFPQPVLEVEIDSQDEGEDISNVKGPSMAIDTQDPTGLSELVIAERNTIIKLSLPTASKQETNSDKSIVLEESPYSISLKLNMYTTPDLNTASIIVTMGEEELTVPLTPSLGDEIMALLKIFRSNINSGNPWVIPPRRPNIINSQDRPDEADNYPQKDDWEYNP